MSARNVFRVNPISVRIYALLYVKLKSGLSSCFGSEMVVIRNAVTTHAVRHVKVYRVYLERRFIVVDV